MTSEEAEVVMRVSKALNVAIAGLEQMKQDLESLGRKNVHPSHIVKRIKKIQEVMAEEQQ